MEQLQKKCQCLTKLFEEVRSRYERRESRQEDLNLISDLRQVIAEQEKDLACVNEEKRYFQMKLRALEMETHGDDGDNNKSPQSPDEFSDCQQEFFEQSYPNFLPQINGPLNTFSIPPTIPECEE